MKTVKNKWKLKKTVKLWKFQQKSKIFDTCQYFIAHFDLFSFEPSEKITSSKK